MPALRAFFNWVLDAVFPIHPAEEEILHMNDEHVFLELPRAVRVPEPLTCSIFSYKDERISRLIWAIKYKKSYIGARIAAYALHRILQYFRRAVPQSMQILIIPMPISRARRRERGYNQSELILEQLQLIDTDKQFLYSKDLLIRAHHTSRQTMKDRENRLASMKNIFKVSETTAKQVCQSIPAENYFVVVIDDVVTTGSTIKCAIEMLRNAGFKNTWGLSVAH